MLVSAGRQTVTESVSKSTRSFQLVMRVMNDLKWKEGWKM